MCFSSAYLCVASPPVRWSPTGSKRSKVAVAPSGMGKYFLIPLGWGALTRPSFPYRAVWRWPLLPHSNGGMYLRGKHFINRFNFKSEMSFEPFWVSAWGWVGVEITVHIKGHWFVLPVYETQTFGFIICIRGHTVTFLAPPSKDYTTASEASSLFNSVDTARCCKFLKGRACISFHFWQPEILNDAIRCWDCCISLR